MSESSDAEHTPDPPEGTARQFWVQSPGRGEIVRSALPPAREGEVLVRTLYTGISRGTESLVFRGQVPPSQFVAMRAPFQEGTLPGPIKYGYSNVGEVLDTAGESASDLRGKTVFSLYPHQDLFRIRASAVSPLPPNLPPARAVLAANMETAVNAVWDSGISVGDRVVVIGAGVVGLLIAWICDGIPGTRALVVDRSPAKASASAGLDLAFATEPDADAETDVVFHASGSPAGLRDALEIAGPEATIVEVSWYGDESVCLPLGGAFHSHRLTIRSSQVGSIPPERAARWTTGRRIRLALRLLQDPVLDILITGESSFDDLPDVMHRLSTKPGAELCHRIRY